MNTRTNVASPSRTRIAVSSAPAGGLPAGHPILVSRGPWYAPAPQCSSSPSPTAARSTGSSPRSGTARSPIARWAPPSGRRRRAPGRTTAASSSGRGGPPSRAPWTPCGAGSTSISGGSRRIPPPRRWSRASRWRCGSGTWGSGRSTPAGSSTRSTTRARWSASASPTGRSPTTPSRGRSASWSNGATRTTRSGMTSSPSRDRPTPRRASACRSPAPCRSASPAIPSAPWPTPPPCSGPGRGDGGGKRLPRFRPPSPRHAEDSRDQPEGDQREADQRAQVVLHPAVGRLAQERGEAGVVRVDKEARRRQQEAEGGQVLPRRLRRPAALLPHHAVGVAVGEVDRHPEHQPADEPPPGGGRQVEHQEDAEHGAQQRDEPRSQGDAEGALPARVLVAQDGDAGADQHEREQRADVGQLHHLV